MVLSAAGRKDVKAEFRVMASSLSKEMQMMEAQLKRWQDTAHETLSLREKSQSLRILLSRKVVYQFLLLSSIFTMSVTFFSFFFSPLV